jgi:CheY-like chemotaxis protein/predicted transcriptional regulator
MRYNSILGSFSFDVIKRILDALNQQGTSMKKTNLASKVGLNYGVCLRYIVMLSSLGWVEANSEVNITDIGKEAFANLLRLSESMASIGAGDDILPSNLRDKSVAHFGSSCILLASSLRTNLPLHSAVTEKQIVPRSKQKTGNKTETIMIVDDEKDVAQTYEYFLSSAGYDVRTFIDSRLALHEYVANPFLYDLLVLDIRMQHINGLQLYQSIKAINPDFRAIFVSCLDVPRETVNLLPGMRPQDIMHKPVSKEQFIIAVKRALMR